MISKERVNAILNKQIPDQVPWGEWAVDFDTVGTSYDNVMAMVDEFVKLREY